MQPLPAPKCRTPHARLGTASVLLASLLTACADEVTAPVQPRLLEATVSGSYVIRTIDGKRLPVTVCAGETKVVGGSLRLRGDHTFLANVRHSSPPGAPREIYQESGTCTRRPGTARLAFQSTTRPGTSWQGSVLTDGSIRVGYPLCGQTYHVRVFANP